MESIATRVRRLREGRQLTQAQLAAEIGVKQPTIANIERGRTLQLKGYVLQGLAAALHTTPDFILEGEEQGDADLNSLKAELDQLWRRLPQQHRETLLQTARGLLRAAEITPPTVVQPASRPKAKTVAA